jgi:hypothetical protein
MSYWQLSLLWWNWWKMLSWLNEWISDCIVVEALSVLRGGCLERLFGDWNDRLLVPFSSLSVKSFV